MISNTLAGLAIETPVEALPESAHLAARLALLDALGCALAGQDAPGVLEGLGMYREWGGKPEATVWFHGDRLPAPAAAFVNSVQLHALDFDDYHAPSDTHIGAVLWPVVLAVGEVERVSGEEALAAFILGVEVAGRLGRVFKTLRTHAGFLPTSVIGGFGATAAACRLKGLDVKRTARALGLFYAHASGNRQALYDRSLAKRMQPGIAAQAAVLSAALAGRGLCGAARIVEGEAGLLRLYALAREWVPVSFGPSPLESTFEVEQLRFKKFACCGRCHGALQAAVDLATLHRIEPGEIECVEIFGVGVNTGMVGVPWDPDHPVPQVLAQFCAPYAVATGIRNLHMGAREISTHRIAQDRAVSDLAAQRTLLRNSADFESTTDGTQTVRIRTLNGRTWTASRCPWGWLPDADAVQAKFLENAAAASVSTPEQAKMLLANCMQIAECDSINVFVRERLTPSDISCRDQIRGSRTKDHE